MYDNSGWLVHHAWAVLDWSSYHTCCGARHLLVLVVTCVKHQVSAYMHCNMSWLKQCHRHHQEQIIAITLNNIQNFKFINEWLKSSSLIHTLLLS